MGALNRNSSFCVMLFAAAIILSGISTVAAQTTGSISGIVTAADNGTPISGLTVCAESQVKRQQIGNAVTTNSLGAYQLTDIPIGNCLVRVKSGLASNNAYYAGKYYSESYIPTASPAPIPVTVSAETDAQGVNFQLKPGGSISGKVLDSDDTPLADVWVHVIHYSSNYEFGSAQTDEAGKFTVRGLPGSPEVDGYKVYAELSIDTYFDGGSKVVIGWDAETALGAITPSTEGEDDDTTTTTTEDTSAPRIVAVLPEDLSEDISLTTEVRITFNETMDSASVEDAFDLQPAIYGSFRWQGTSLIFHPSHSLVANTTYTVTIKNTAKDSHDNLLAEDYTWSFTTAEPEVESSKESDEGYGCFIATAAYGADKQWINNLTAFRDQYLLPTAGGTAFLRLYYHVSPPLAQIIAVHPELRAMTRLLLWPAQIVVEAWRLKGLFLFCGVIMILVGSLAFKLRRKATI